MPARDLPANGRFIFGSNKQGEHYGGAARFAYEKLGAEWGVGEGPTGRCYAFPTLNYANTAKREGKDFGELPHMVTVEEFDASYKKMFDFIAKMKKEKFYLTKIGLGIAGWDLDTVKGLFWKYYDPQVHVNLVFPREFDFTDEELKTW